jgi:hypothetical protein
MHRQFSRQSAIATEPFPLAGSSPRSVPNFKRISYDLQSPVSLALPTRRALAQDAVAPSTPAVTATTPAVLPSQPAPEAKPAVVAVTDGVKPAVAKAQFKAPSDSASASNFSFRTMRTGTKLLIGGLASTAIGLAVVGGNVGGGMAVAGSLASLLGLYINYR